MRLIACNDKQTVIHDFRNKNQHLKPRTHTHDVHNCFSGGGGGWGNTRRVQGKGHVPNKSKRKNSFTTVICEKSSQPITIGGAYRNFEKLSSLFALSLGVRYTGWCVYPLAIFTLFLKKHRRRSRIQFTLFQFITEFHLKSNTGTCHGQRSSWCDQYTDLQMVHARNERVTHCLVCSQSSLALFTQVKKGRTANCYPPLIFIAVQESDKIKQQ